MGFLSFFADLFGSNNREPLDRKDEENDEFETRPTVGDDEVRGECSPSSPEEDDFLLSEGEAPELNMKSPQQKRIQEQRRRKVTDLKRRLLKASEELDDTLAEFKTGPPSTETT